MAKSSASSAHAALEVNADSFSRWWSEQSTPKDLIQPLDNPNLRSYTTDSSSSSPISTERAMSDDDNYYFLDDTWNYAKSWDFEGLWDPMPFECSVPSYADLIEERVISVQQEPKLALESSDNLKRKHPNNEHGKDSQVLTRLDHCKEKVGINCPDCGKEVRGIKDLRRHQSKHTCTVCSRSFGSTSDRNRHTREVHGPGSHLMCPIPICPRHTRAFKRRWNLDEHIRRLHPETLIQDRSERIKTSKSAPLMSRSPSLEASIGTLHEDDDRFSDRSTPASSPEPSEQLDTSLRKSNVNIEMQQKDHYGIVSELTVLEAKLGKLDKDRGNLDSEVGMLKSAVAKLHRALLS